jgi:SHS2 domain-containing protein
MEKFEVLDVSGDIGLKAYGKTITEAFSNAAIGMYSLTANLRSVEEKKSLEVSIESGTLDGLLVSWLNELIFHFDAHGFIGKRIVVRELFQGGCLPESNDTCKIRATVYGEEFDPERHEGKLLIKAATYHRLRIEQKDDLWEIDVIFDI